MSALHVARRLFVAGSALSCVAVASYLKYTEGVRSVRALADTPRSFQTAFARFAKSASTVKPMAWGFYLQEVPIDASDGGDSISSVESFVQRTLGSRWYWLERAVTGITEDPAILKCVEGEWFGQLECVERISSNEVLWRYRDESLDYALFMGVYADAQARARAAIGFIELRGDSLEVLGSRVLVPLLVAGITSSSSAKAQFARKAFELEAANIETLQRQLAAFRSQLEGFARTHAAAIQKDPAFRQRFQTMCATVGVDPLACAFGFVLKSAATLNSPQSTFSHQGLLGFVLVLVEAPNPSAEICIATRERTGGLVDFHELKRLVEKMRGSNAVRISDDDIVQAVKSMAVLGNDFQVVTYGSRKMVQSVPRELNPDYDNVMAMAQESGYVTVRSVADACRWDEMRAEAVLSRLLQDGICWIDLQADSHQYWVVSFVPLE
ncbi:ESCRT-II subunit protein snf8 [Entophlyctis luteolus]|nr:ESCRT-II subunit protein snf8 [Entophlyctis luteolus]